MDRESYSKTLAECAEIKKCSLCYVVVCNMTCSNQRIVNQTFLQKLELSTSMMTCVDGNKTSTTAAHSQRMCTYVCSILAMKKMCLR